MVFNVVAYEYFLFFVFSMAFSIMKSIHYSFIYYAYK